MKINNMKLNSEEKFIWDTCSNNKLPPHQDKKMVWNQLIQRMRMYDNENKTTNTVIKNFIKKIRYWPKLKPAYLHAIGVVIIVFFVISLFNNIYLTDTIRTKATERKVLDLADGSVITLHSGSEIIYNKGYNETHRKIYLTGEAYFKVQKKDLPFIIQTEHGQITVLGTIFNVRSRSDGFEIGVTEGTVNISNHICAINLGRGQLVQTTSDFSETDVQNIYYNNYPDWLDYKIYCNKTELLEVCSEIQRIFDVKFIFSQPDFENIPLTGIINSSNLVDVLKTLSMLTNHDFKLSGDTVMVI